MLPGHQKISSNKSWSKVPSEIFWKLSVTTKVTLLCAAPPRWGGDWLTPVRIFLNGDGDDIKSGKLLWWWWWWWWSQWRYDRLLPALISPRSPWRDFHGSFITSKILMSLIIITKEVLVLTHWKQGIGKPLHGLGCKQNTSLPVYIVNLILSFVKDT